MNDMLSFIYLASLFAVGGAAFSLMWKNISDIKNEQFNKYNTRPHPEMEGIKYGEELLVFNPEDEEDDDEDDGDIIVRI